MKLSKRLETIASLVPKGSKVADIGTDHGYIPIYLIQNHIASQAFAMDVRKGPLLRAQSHISEAGLEEQIKVRLSDGLLQLKKQEADCVVIAGMGGELIIHILEEGRHLWEDVSDWILSPQSDLHKVRKFLHEQGFSVENEVMVKEDGKYYFIMKVFREITDSTKEERDIFYYYGKSLLEAKNPVLKEYLEKEEMQLKRLWNDLSGSKTEAVSKRLSELEFELALNKEAQNEMQ